MGVRIIDNADGAVLYCSTSMEAFGPVFDDRQDAEDFCDWFTDGHALMAALTAGTDVRARPDGRDGHDPRAYDPATLRTLYDIWVTERERALSDDEVGDLLDDAIHKQTGGHPGIGA